jgi:hypothetical protein
MLARVKQDYTAGSVMAFSGREYVRSEWREVPAGFEEQAKNHPLLEVQPSLDEVRAGSSMAPGLGRPAPEATIEEAVTPVLAPGASAAETAEPPAESQPTEPPAEETPAEESEPKTPRHRRRAAED